MKKNIIFSIGLLVLTILLPNVSFASDFFTDASGSIAPKIPIVGRVDNATQSWSGSLITNFDANINRTPINEANRSEEMYFNNATNTFSGFLVLTAACATTDCKKPTTNDWDESAFVTFNHGVSGFEAKFGAPTGNVYPMTGFAWSKSSGWIAFNVGLDPVKYNRTTGLFSGFAWSKNLGYISMSGLQMRTNVPKLNLLGNWALANHEATFDLINSGAIDGLGEYFLWIDSYSRSDAGNPDSTTYETDAEGTGRTDGLFTDVDIRATKATSSSVSIPYSYKIKDPFGNYATGSLSVIANTPANLDTTINIGSNAMSGDQYSISSGDKKANGFDNHFVTMSLHDKYGNEIISVNGIKDVVATIEIGNMVSPNQTGIASTDLHSNMSDPSAVGKSITFSGSSNLYTKLQTVKSSDISNTSTSYRYTFSGSDSPNGGLGIMSYMPTVGSNQATLSGSYIVKSLLSDLNLQVGQMSSTGSFTKSFNFTQLWDGGSSLIPSDGGTKFGINLPFTTQSAFSSSGTLQQPAESNGNTYHLYKTHTGGILLKSFIVFTGADTNMGNQNFGNEWSYTNQGTSSGFELIPKMEKTLSGTTIDFDLDHKLVRIFGFGSNMFAYTIASSSTGVTQNRGIKILGSASSGNKDAIFALNDTDAYAKVGNFRKPQVRDMILQNVESLKRNTPSDVAVITTPGEKLSSYVSKQTIIVVNHDFTIDTNWGSKTDSPRAIIVIGGDVKIDSGVQTIYASIFTDHGIKASASSDKQLYIYGTLISGNTIGTTAKLANTVCPDFLTSCTEQQKKDYDLNFLRSGSSNPVAPLSSEYSLVIEYNPKLTSDPPPGFKKIAR